MDVFSCFYQRKECVGYFWITFQVLNLHNINFSTDDFQFIWTCVNKNGYIDSLCCTGYSVTQSQKQPVGTDLEEQWMQKVRCKYKYSKHILFISYLTTWNLIFWFWKQRAIRLCYYLQILPDYLGPVSNKFCCSDKNAHHAITQWFILWYTQVIWVPLSV